MKNFGAQNMVSTLKKVLMKKPQKFMSKINTQKWNYIAPLDQDLINENYNDFYKIVKNSGIEIVELRLDDENEVVEQKAEDKTEDDDQSEEKKAKGKDKKKKK